MADELLSALRDRAAGYDEANAYPEADVDALRESGHLRLGVPVELGGGGASFAEVVRAQRRLASFAPATALTVNMHQIWVAAAARLRLSGDDSLEWLLRDAVAGELFAFGISEAGNDDVLFDSRSIATAEADGGWRVSGTKIFTTAAPAWTRLGVHARIADTEMLVFGFIERDDAVETSTHWDALGMRATQSRSTVLNGARVSPDRIARTLAVGPTTDPLVLGIFGSFELLIAAVYLGIADRALELAIAATARLDADGVARSQDAAVRRRIAEAARTIDLASTYLQATVTAFADEDRGFGWFRPLVTAKTTAVAAARTAVDHALAVVGGAAFDQGSELSRLYRDVLAGDFHPSSPDKALETIATNLLGPRV